MHFTVCQNINVLTDRKIKNWSKKHPSLFSSQFSPARSLSTLKQHLPSLVETLWRTQRDAAFSFSHHTRKFLVQTSGMRAGNKPCCVCVISRSSLLTILSRGYERHASNEVNNTPPYWVRLLRHTSQIIYIQIETQRYTVVNKDCTAISVSQKKLKQQLRDNTPPAPKVCTNSSNVVLHCGCGGDIYALQRWRHISGQRTTSR